MTGSERAGGWVVMKFGGTSVADQAGWGTIAQEARARTTDGHRVMVVVSAIRGVTDRLLAAVSEPEQAGAALEWVRGRYRKLADEIGVEPPARFVELDTELGQLLDLPADELGRPQTQARVMAMGELLCSALGAEILKKSGLDCAWQDARRLLVAGGGDAANRRTDYLSATCERRTAPELAAELAAQAPVHITQGFIAADAAGDTVLLGRGGSDTSGSYLAVLLGAEALEIWGGVPGLFSADPGVVPGARLLKNVTYREAQELASMGAKVLHPRCIAPVREDAIPLHIRWTEHPDAEGTVISAHAREFGAQVKGIVHRTGITLVSMEGLDMWHQAGFLADAFAAFKDHGVSVDMVSTSEANVTVSLDWAGHLLDETVVAALVRDLEKICRVGVIHDCASVSLVGVGIRTILHRLGPALEVFENRHIYLVSQASNDLNLTFAVDQRDADKLVLQLHRLLIPGGVGGDSVFGQTWQEMYHREPPATARVPWWRRRREELLAKMDGHDALYAYSLAALGEAAQRLSSLANVDRLLYSMKANAHPEILRELVAAGMGLECVSIGEVERALEVPGIEPGKILFTPNFAPRDEYRRGLELGVLVTIDNLFVLEHWGEDFRGREVFLRLDPGSGLGHHKLVRTAGAHSKFGIPAVDLEVTLKRVAELDLRVSGLHAHIGSGVMHSEAWQRTLIRLAESLDAFPEVCAIDLGGGLGVPDKGDELPFDLGALDASLGEVRSNLSRAVEIWLEPGRYLVAECGVLLARVTQTKGKGEVRYLGVATGMNSLIRPTLYGAYHEIFNLTRLDAPPAEVCNVVGPICETGDTLGLDRLLPASREGDVLLIANTGAYGAAMGSRYNLRDPAPEVTLD